MRLLRVVHSLCSELGGPVTAIQAITPALATLGVETEVISLADEKVALEDKWSIPVHGMGGASFYGYTPRLATWLRAHHKSFNAVIVHGCWQYQGLGVWRVFRNQRTPYLVYPHGMLDPWFKFRYPLKHLKKCLYWPWGEYRVLRDAAAVLFTSEEEKRQARKSFWLYRCRERVVNYGTAAPTGDPIEQEACFLKEFPRLEGKRILLFLGRVHEKKGVNNLIRAWARIQKVDIESSFAKASEDAKASEEKNRKADRQKLHLVIAGPGEEDSFGRRMKRLAKELGVAGSITWTECCRAILNGGHFTPVMPSSCPLTRRISGSRWPRRWLAENRS